MASHRKIQNRTILDYPIKKYRARIFSRFIEIDTDFYLRVQDVFDIFFVLPMETTDILQTLRILQGNYPKKGIFFFASG